MSEWVQAPHSRRHALYCNMFGHRLFVEAMRWGHFFEGVHQDEYQGLVGGVRVGVWSSLEGAKRGTAAEAKKRPGCETGP
jgi:hypothetical protein